METARITPLVMGGLEHSLTVSSSTPTTTTRRPRSSSKAVESAVVDAYATRVLRKASPPEACMDDSLGPYVTAVLRCSLGSSEEDETSVTELPEFESLVELLEEHCCLMPTTAQEALQTIATAVQTGVVPEPLEQVPPLPTQPHTLSVETTAASALDPSQEYTEAFPSLQVSTSSATKGQPGTPLKPDALIPFDLMGILDDPVEEKTEVQPEKEEEVFPPLSASTSTCRKSKSAKKTEVVAPEAPTLVPEEEPTEQVLSKKKSKRASQKKDKDLAAALFRPASRARQNSMDDESPKLPPQADSYNNNEGYYAQDLEQALEVLWSWNPELGQEALCEAAQMAQGNLQVAQGQIIDGALSAPPVCRHMLSDGCYRSDCQFTHTLETHTCLFWMRGRCGKGDACRFLHGFSETLLLQPPPDPGDSSPPHTQPISITAPTSFSLPQAELNPFSSQTSSSNTTLSTSWGALSSCAEASPPLDAEFSFAKIASQGYGASSFAQSPPPTTTEAKTPKTVKIPQDLWNPHINRSADVFHIQDPLERYRAVAACVDRDDVIDLHYQSTKTFSIILEAVLLEKLRQAGDVWIVTGTGHHVKAGHQKGGGALETALVAWLTDHEFDFCRGKDRNGYGGAVLVKPS